MAFITTEEVRAIRNQLKKQLPEYKFSVTKQHYSKVNVSILKGPIELESKPINTYWFKDHYEDQPVLIALFTAIINIIKTAPALVTGDVWFDESDSQTDYFNTAYYFDLRVGKWNKDYIQVK